MVGFRGHVLLLTAVATAIAIGAVLTSSGFVDVGISDRLDSGVVTGFSLLLLSLLVAGLYESRMDQSES